MAVSNNKTSHLISSQVPQYVREDHGTFVEFLEDYYKFMEQENQVLNVSKNFLRYKDVDLAEDIFIQKLYDNFIRLIPSNVLADRTLILKHVKDFYRSRGSEKSVRFLMRILFDKEIEFYYPKRDILRASDGKWYVENSIKISDIQVNNVSNSSAASNFTAKKIRGVTSNATAIVESVDVYYELGIAHALKKPVVLVSSNEEDVPFDLKHVRVIYYDYRDPFWGEKLIKKIAENITGFPLS